MVWSPVSRNSVLSMAACVVVARFSNSADDVIRMVWVSVDDSQLLGGHWEGAGWSEDGRSVWEGHGSAGEGYGSAVDGLGILLMSFSI